MKPSAWIDREFARLERDNSALRKENETLRHENAKLLSELVAARDLAYNRQVQALLSATGDRKR